MKYCAQCHCGNVAALFDTPSSIEVLGVRECSCTFCQKHKALYASDSKGSLSITVRDPADLNRYSFAMKTIEFLICKTCGVCVAAVFPDGGKYYGILNARTIGDKTLQLPEAKLMDYDAENKETRILRRKAHWTPLGALALGKAA